MGLWHEEFTTNGRVRRERACPYFAIFIIPDQGKGVPLPYNSSFYGDHCRRQPIQIHLVFHNFGPAGYSIIQDGYLAFPYNQINLT
ncbi:MAG TPA: hypothetical protein DCY35_02320 [Prolixibacteraceae bacterium]|nr:hypothetical protein [Prolixibacteraceae bacterium]